MPQWTVDAPTRLAFDDVTALRVRVIAGSVAILATSEAPALDITRISGQPLTVTHEDGLLTISYEDLTWDGLLEWLRPRNHSADLMVTVPRDCPAQVGVVAATAIVSGITARTSVKSVSGAITLDGLNGKVDARTIGADVEAQDINGQVTFNSVSGDLTLAGGSLDRLDAKTVTGRVTADVHLGKPGDVRVATVSSDVALRLPAAPDARVSLRSTSGRLLTEFDGLRRSHSPGSHSVSGTLGAGTGHISVTTLSGRVTLLSRAPQAGTGRNGPPQAAPPQAAPPQGATRGQRPAGRRGPVRRIRGRPSAGRAGGCGKTGPGPVGGGHRSRAHRQRRDAGRRTDEGRDSMSPVFRHGRLRLYLLRLLDEEPRHGYEVIRMLRDQFMGVYAPSPGTIYPRLARLEEEGLVTHDELDGRKVYRITDAGRQELHEREDELAELEQELSDSVRDVVREVKEDVRETVRNLREELTWAARSARQPDETGSERPAPGDQLRAQAEDVRQRARWSREEAKEQARRVRDEARENARRAKDDAKEWARQEREQARSSGRDWEWASWAGWADSPGRRGRPGRPDAAPLRDLEQTVKGFVRDLGLAGLAVRRRGGRGRAHRTADHPGRDAGAGPQRDLRGRRPARGPPR